MWPDKTVMVLEVRKSESRVSINKDGRVQTSVAATEVFELLMGSDVAPRKEFLVQGAYEVDVEALDA